MADPTKLDVPIPAPTLLDSAAPAPTLLDSGAAPSPHIHVQLPPTLAARFRIERQFPAHGAEADVLLAQPLTGEDHVVLKLYRPGIQPKTDVLERIARAAPEHVVQLYEHGQADGIWYEVLEYAPHGSLRDLMHGPAAPERALAVLDELSAALGYLHTQQIIHRDLKPENVLVRRLQPLDLALTDFGIASVSEFSQHHTNLSRTVRYSAPEALSGVLSAKADWWSLGLVLLEMLGGKHPFDGLSDAVILHWLITRPIDVTAVTDPAWNTLCRGLLLRDPQQRWGLAEIQRWRRGENVEVASEDTPAVISATTTQRPYKIGGKTCFSAEQLGRALAQHWNEAVKHLERGLILGWVRDELKDQALASFVMDLAAENLPADEKLLKLIRQLAPDLPPVYRGIAISGEDLFKLAQQAAQGDNAAEELFWNIYERDILGYFPQDTRLQQLREAWRQGVAEYQSGWETIIQAGAPSKYRPELHVALPSLFLALFNNQNADRLRKQIQIDDIIRRHTHWYLALGEPEKITCAHLPILVTLAPQIINARKQFEHFYRLLEKAPPKDPIYPLLCSLLPLAEGGEGELLQRELQRQRVLPIFDVKTITVIKTFNPSCYIETLIFSSDGRQLVLGFGIFKDLILWDIESESKISVSIENVSDRNKTELGISIAISSDGHYLASASRDGVLRLWDLEINREIRYWKLNFRSLSSVAISPNGDLLGSGGNGSVSLWDIESGRENLIENLQYHKFEYYKSKNYKGNIKKVTTVCPNVNAVVFSPNGRLLAWGSNEWKSDKFTVGVTEIETGKTIWKGGKDIPSVGSMAFSPNGQRLAIGSYEYIYLWSTRSKSITRKFWVQRNTTINSVVFSPDGRLLASIGSDKKIRLWDVKSKSGLAIWTSVENDAFAFSPNGCLLATKKTNNEICLWGTSDSIENYLKEKYPTI